MIGLATSKAVNCGALGAFLLTTLLAAPAVAKAPVRGVCAFSAYNKDRDPHGLNVRAGPGTASKIIGVISPLPDDEHINDVPFQLKVLQARDGWFFVEYETLTPNTTRKQNHQGWVSGAMLDFTVQRAIGQAKPDQQSPIVWTPDRRSQPDTVPFSRVLDCEGPWALLELRSGAKTRQAWFTQLCDNPLTTCN